MADPKWKIVKYSGWWLITMNILGCSIGLDARPTFTEIMFVIKQAGSPLDFHNSVVRRFFDV